MHRFPWPLFVLSTLAAAQRLDFETMPDGSEPIDEMKISDQFAGAPYFIRFERTVGGSPDSPSGTIFEATLARIGSPRTAFEGVSRSSSCDSATNRHDNLRVGAYPTDPNEPDLGSGCYFLTDDGIRPSGSAANQDLIVRYTVPVTAASGYLLDVDNNEFFRVIPRDENDIPIDGLIQSFFGSGQPDGSAVQWSFESTEPIWSIYIDQASSGTRGIAFDEFSPNSACPGLVEYYGTGVAGFEGRTPILTVSCPRVGQPFRMQVHNGMPLTHGCIVVGSGRLDPPRQMPGGLLFVRPPMITVDAHNLDLKGSFVLEIPALDLSLLGRTFNAQAAYSDALAPEGISYTAAVEFSVSL